MPEYIRKDWMTVFESPYGIIKSAGITAGKMKVAVMSLNF